MKNFKSLYYILMVTAVYGICIPIAPDGICTSIQKKEFETIIAQNNDLPALLMSVKILTNHAHLTNEQPPVVNLCHFPISHYQLFCQYNKGLARMQMPQIEGFPKPGSKAEQMVNTGILQRRPDGQVDLKDLFIAAMDAKFGACREEVIGASSLKATQNEINGVIVASMWWTLKQNPKHSMLRSALLIAKDNYILDGHHRWAAINALEYGQAKARKVSMRVMRVNTDITTLLKEALQFVKEYGIAAESL